MFESVLKISEHVEICNACCKHIEKECYYNNNLLPSHLQVSLMFFVMALRLRSLTVISLLVPSFK